HVWKIHEERVAHEIERSKADAELKKYTADFVEALESGLWPRLTNPAKASPGQDHGSQLVAHFRERYESEHRRESDSPQRRRQALAEYLVTAEGVNEASKIGIPVSVLSVAAKKFR